MSFRIQGLSPAPFADLFALDDRALAARGAVARTADSGGFPCRVSLTDAPLGARVILVNHEHHAVDSPYRSNFAIYVREGERQFDAVDEVPEQLRKRTLAVRGYDADGMLVAADLAEGPVLEAAIERLFAEPRVQYLHVHFAKPGCYAARVERA